MTTYISYEDESAVRKQIENRSKMDSAYYACLSGGSVDINVSSGTSTVVEDVMCIYMDLDQQIEEAEQSPSEGFVVAQLMQGYGLTDIAEHMEVRKQTADSYYKRAVSKICARARKQWDEFYSDGRASDHPDCCLA